MIFGEVRGMAIEDTEAASTNSKIPSNARLWPPRDPSLRPSPGQTTGAGISIGNEVRHLPQCRHPERRNGMSDGAKDPEPTK